MIHPSDDIMPDIKYTCIVFVFFLFTLGLAGCGEKPVSLASATPVPSPTAEPIPKLTQQSKDIPMFASNSPFQKEYRSPVQKEPKKLWARSILWEKAPELAVEKWLTDEPNTQGKYVLIEFWATWCSQCRKSIPELNRFHKTWGEKLAVIGLSDEPESEVSKMKTPAIEYYSAIDTQGRMKEELGVMGIPHVILIEPEGHVVWEGFPLLEGYELTDAVIEKIIHAKS